MIFLEKVGSKNFGRIRGFPELPRIFRTKLGSAADEVRDQNFGLENPGQFFFSLKTPRYLVPQITPYCNLSHFGQFYFLF